MEGNKHTDLLSQRKKRIFSVRNLVFLVICIFLLVFLISIFDVDTFDRIIRQTNPLYLAAAALCYLASNFFKTVRFLVFFDTRKISLSGMFTVVSYHNFFNQIMPARTGELTLVYYLKKIVGIDMSRGVHSLLIVRFMDLFIVALFFILSFLLTAADTVSPALLAAAIIIGIAALTVILLISRCMRIAATLYTRTARLLRLDRIGVLQKIGVKLHELAESFSRESVVHKIPMLVVTSIFVWGALYTFSYCIILAFTAELSYFQSVLGATAAVLTNVLPINSFGSFGTMEAGWVGGYYLVGIGKNVAILSAFAYHLVNFISAAAIAFVCMIIIRLRSAK